MAEWLRRWTRNPMGYARAGSNPAHCGCFFFFPLSFFYTFYLHHCVEMNHVFMASLYDPKEKDLNNESINNFYLFDVSPSW